MHRGVRRCEAQVPSMQFPGLRLRLRCTLAAARQTAENHHRGARAGQERPLRDSVAFADKKPRAGDCAA
jgi:hypothetical protein